MPDQDYFSQVSIFDLAHDVVGIISELDLIQGLHFTSSAVAGEIDHNDGTQLRARVEKWDQSIPALRCVRATMNQYETRHFSSPSSE